MPAGEGKRVIRGSIDAETYRRVKELLGFKNGGKDWNYGDAIEEALQDWLKRPENVKLMKEHNIK